MLMATVERTFCSYCKKPTPIGTVCSSCLEEIHGCMPKSFHFESSGPHNVLRGYQKGVIRLWYRFDGYYVKFYAYNTLVAVLFDQQLTMCENVFSTHTSELMRIIEEMGGNDNARTLPIHAYRNFLQKHDIHTTLYMINSRDWFEPNHDENVWVRDSRLSAYWMGWAGRQYNGRSTEQKKWMKKTVEKLENVRMPEGYVLYFEFNRTRFIVRVWHDEKDEWTYKHEFKSWTRAKEVVQHINSFGMPKFKPLTMFIK